LLAAARGSHSGILVSITVTVNSHISVTIKVTDNLENIGLHGSTGHFLCYS